MHSVTVNINGFFLFLTVGVPLGVFRRQQKLWFGISDLKISVWNFANVFADL